MAEFLSRARHALCSASGLLILLLFCLVCRIPPADAIEGTRTYRVVAVAPDDVLNMRAGPSMGYPIVGAIPPGGRGVRLVGGCREWCPVSYNGATGWVNGRYLAVDPAVAPFARRLDDDDDEASPPRPTRDRRRAQLPSRWKVTGVAEGESLKVHDSPSGDGAVVHAFEPQSSCIKLTGACRKPWCQVAFPGLSGDRVGWVDSKHLAPASEACR